MSEERTEVVVEVGAMHGLVLLDSRNWKVVRRAKESWAFVGYYPTVSSALGGLLNAEIAAAAEGVARVEDLRAAILAAVASVNESLPGIEDRLVALVDDQRRRDAGLADVRSEALAKARASRVAA